MEDITVGFIGQGWIGKHFADEFEARKFRVVRYALEEPYRHNRIHLTDCNVVFVAVPTPTTPEGVDYSILVDALQHVPAGAIAVIKSSMLPGTTERLQTLYPNIFVLHSPEFLVEASAAYDAAHPNRNIIGIPIDTQEYRDAATMVLKILPDAPYNRTMSSRAAELVKYAGNCFLFTKVLYSNLMYDIAEATGVEYEVVREAMSSDPRIGDSHTKPIHSSGRGAGGHCFIKDFEALRVLHNEVVGSGTGQQLFDALSDHNLDLLIESQKDLDLVTGVHGEERVARGLHKIPPRTA